MRTRWLTLVPVLLGISLAVAALALSHPAARAAADIYVNRLTGSDAPTCGAPGSPCYSIAYAITNRASAGDRVLVAPGLYPETINLKAGVDVASTSGPAVTIIDGQHIHGPMVWGSDAAETLDD